MFTSKPHSLYTVFQTSSLFTWAPDRWSKERSLTKTPGFLVVAHVHHPLYWVTRVMKTKRDVSAHKMAVAMCQRWDTDIQGDSFGTRPKKMRISQRLFIRFWTCVYDYLPCFMRTMLILEEMLEMFATTVQAELNAMLRVCESGLQDVLTNRSNFTSNAVFQFLYGSWLVAISFSF